MTIILAAAGMIVMHLPMFGHDHHHAASDPANSWKEGLRPDQVEKIEKDAKAAGLTPAQFMNPICITPPDTQTVAVEP